MQRSCASRLAKVCPSWELTVAALVGGAVKGLSSKRAARGAKRCQKQRICAQSAGEPSIESSDGEDNLRLVSSVANAGVPSNFSEVGTTGDPSVSVDSPTGAEDVARRNLLTQGACVAFGASVFVPIGRQTPWYQFVVAQLQGSGGSASFDDVEMLRAVAGIVPKPTDGIKTLVLDLGAGTGGDLKFILGADLPGPIDIVAVEPNTFTWPSAEQQARSLGFVVMQNNNADVQLDQEGRQLSRPHSALMRQPNDSVNVASEQIPMELAMDGEVEAAAAGTVFRDSPGTLSVVRDTAVVPNDSVTLVVCKSVLCSVDDPQAVVRDVFRVLKPGGALVFVEHIAASEGSALRLVQQLWKPFQQAFAGGCDPARDTYQIIREACPWDRVFGQQFEVQGDGPIAPHIRGFAVKPY